MARAILFDAAGTLIELTEPVGEHYSRIAAQHGVELPAWRLSDAFGRVLAGMPAMCFPDAEASAVRELERDWWREAVRRTFLAADSTVRFADFAAFFDAVWREFADAASWRLRDGVAEMLAELRASGTPMGVVSNFDHRLPEILKKLGIINEFQCMILPGTHRVAKPDPAVFAPALAELGAIAEQSIYVGDEPEVDGVAAARAGLRFVDASELASIGELRARLG